MNNPDLNLELLAQSSPFSRFELSPDDEHNMRPAAIPLAKLRTSIKAHWLLRNLNTDTEGPEPHGVRRGAAIATGCHIDLLDAPADTICSARATPRPAAWQRMTKFPASLLQATMSSASIHPAGQLRTFRALADATSLSPTSPHATGTPGATRSTTATLVQGFRVVADRFAWPLPLVV